MLAASICNSNLSNFLLFLQEVLPAFFKGLVIY